MNIRVLMLSVLISAVPLTPLWADDVTDQINEALKAYDHKDLPTAISGLEAAVSLVRQMRADSYGSLLPEAPAGWTADKVETISVGIAMAGGGTGATRKYHKGNDTVTVSILTDSPLLQVVSTLAGSGMVGIGGLQTRIVNGRRTIYVKDEGSYTTIVGDPHSARAAGPRAMDSPKTNSRGS